MNTKIKIGILTADNPENKRSWSGIHYRMYKSLENEFLKIVLLGPIEKNNFLERTLYFVSKLHLLLFSKRFNKLHNVLRSKYYAKNFAKKLKQEKFDILFAPAAATEIAFLKTNIPICYLSDTSFGQISKYYDTFSAYSNLSNKESNIIESRAIKNATHLVYSSAWAANYVAEHYSVNPQKISIVPFGANIEGFPEKRDLNKEYNGRIQILFTAKHWVRKGGGIVLETFKILVDNGADVGLTILGCNPPTPIEDARVKVVPFLNKNIPEEEEKFLRILNSSHIFFLPTRADCTPVVLCEANAYGMPAITTDTGGVTSIIENGVNGYALPLDATPDDYAKQIQKFIDNPEKLKGMAIKSREKFERELNWASWASRMKEIFLDVSGSGFNNDSKQNE